ncbi:MAG: cytochrome-c peroxidase [Bdellovibrionales bacterium]|nr:cytochrome-c peroxidase [Bdellovibrionales bacterium]
MTTKLVLAVCATFLIQAAQALPFDPLPAKPPIPADNPQTPAKIELGKKLYFDPRISKQGTISCNSCHNVMLGGDDNRPNSIGHNGQRGARSAPTVWNSAFLSVQFWDGRAKSLEEQAKGPLTNPVEMAMDSQDVVLFRIRKVPGYLAEFKKVWPNIKTNEDITIDYVAKAIASYERTLIAGGSPYDQFLRGNKKALSAQAQAGMKLVQEVGCTSCHMGANFAGPPLPEGTGFYQKFPVYPGSEYDAKYDLLKDKGRFEVTKAEQEKNMWRVPTWRNIALTAPYFHNGSVKTLDEAVKVMAKTQLNKDLKPEEVSSIVSFLESLTGKFPEQKMPRLPETPGVSIVE